MSKVRAVINVLHTSSESFYVLHTIRNYFTRGSTVNLQTMGVRFRETFSQRRTDCLAIWWKNIMKYVTNIQTFQSPIRARTYDIIVFQNFQGKWWQNLFYILTILLKKVNWYTERLKIIIFRLQLLKQLVACLNAVKFLIIKYICDIFQ